MLHGSTLPALACSHLPPTRPHLPSPAPCPTRYVTQLMASIPTITDTMVRRMAKDEEEMAAFFAKYLKQEKVGGPGRRLGPPAQSHWHDTCFGLDCATGCAAWQYYCGASRHPCQWATDTPTPSCYLACPLACLQLMSLLLAWHWTQPCPLPCLR